MIMISYTGMGTKLNNISYTLVQNSYIKETNKYIISEKTIKDYFNFIKPKISEESIYRLLSPLLNIFFGIPDSKQFKIDIHSKMKDHNFDALERVFLKFVNEKKLLIN